MTVHPIEADSYRVLEGRVDLSGHPPAVAAVIARVIHASADLEFATTMRVTPEAVEAGMAAIRAGAPVITDVEMVAAGITSVPACCYLPEVAAAPAGTTRSAAAVRLAAMRHPEGAVLVVGCAPTALFEAVRLVEAGQFAPALVVGLPVGFVGAAESKDAAHAAAVPTITNAGEKGGSAVASAALNAIARLADSSHGRR